MSKGRICNACKQEIQRDMLDRNHSICPRCGYYMRMHARKRILSLADKKSFREWDANMELSNPLNDSEYAQKSVETSAKHKLNDAIITGEMNIDGSQVAIGVMDTRYMMASMGYVVGEKVTRLFEKATKKKLPVIMFCCSGGARMQEGIISLMQMEKTAAAVRLHSESGLLYISVLTNPTMGGVTASFAMLADVILAEKNAMIGFAGRRVIEQNTGEKLPNGFQTAEYQKQCGFIDAIVTRECVREMVSKLLLIHSGKNANWNKINKAKTSKVTPLACDTWERVKIVREKSRPTSMDYINAIFNDFFEVSGDRIFGDDKAIVTGLATFHGKSFTVIGEQKGKRTLDDAVYRNFGMPSPEGYRKALRAIKQAEKFKRPIVCFVDTIGAACGVDAEKRGQGLAIAELLSELSVVKTPILSIIIGEGYSGGALALAVGNEIWMLDNAVYSIISPEGYSSIMWGTNDRRQEAAEKMKMSSAELYRMNIVDKVIAEGGKVTMDNIDEVSEFIECEIIEFCNKYCNKSIKRVVQERQNRYRKY